MHFHIAEYLSLPYLSKKLISHKATETWSSRSAVYQICQIRSIPSTGIHVWVLVFTLCRCSSHPEDVLKNYHNSSTLLQPHCVHPPRVLLNLQHWKGTVSESCCCQVHICMSQATYHIVSSNMCHIMFTLNVYVLTFISAGRGDDGRVKALTHQTNVKELFASKADYRVASRLLCLHQNSALERTEGDDCSQQAYFIF